jgi:hypothetical protein
MSEAVEHLKKQVEDAGEHTHVMLTREEGKAILDVIDTRFNLNIIQVSDESLECLIDMAGYGIAYWASAAEYDNEARTYTVTENEEGEYEKHVITYDKIIEAFWKAANPGAEIEGWSKGTSTRKYALDAVIDGIREGNGDIEAGHIDADLADNIIQLAAFGEVQYG